MLLLQIECDQAEEILWLGARLEPAATARQLRVENDVSCGEKFRGECVSEDIGVVAPSALDRSPSVERRDCSAGSWGGWPSAMPQRSNNQGLGDGEGPS